MNDQTVTVRELSRKITAVEQGVCTEHATGEPYRNVYNALSQTHLSTMADVGLLDYDQQRQQVTRNEHLLTAATLTEFNRVIYIYKNLALMTFSGIEPNG
jgi:hypothetical protein